VLRSFIGFVAFNGLAFVLGTSALFALGLVQRRISSVIAAGGAALLTGLALLGLGALLGVLAGLGMDVLVVTVCGVVATAVLALIGWRRAAEPAPRPEERRLPPAIVWVPPAIVLAFVAIQLLWSREVPVAWDAAHIWTLKAVALSESGELDGQMFTDSGAFGAAHLDYPLLHPVLGALTFRFAAKSEQGILLGELWLILGAAVLAVPWLLRAGRWSWLALAPMVLALVSAPAAGLLRGDADVPMACFLAAGAVALIRSHETSRLGYAALAALWLGAAANIKNEGTAFAFAVLVAGLAVIVLSRPRRRSVLVVGAAAAVGTALLAVPWRLWVSANGPFSNDVAPLSDSLDIGYLFDRLPQLDLGADTLFGRLADPGAYWLVPALLAVTVVIIAAGRMRPIAAYYLGATVLCICAVLWTYWTSQLVDIAGHIQRTTIRTITGPLFLAAAGLAHLLPRLVQDVRLLGDPSPLDEPADADAERASATEPAGAVVAPR
jgi:hypothetical protein